jgi:hypothetical protein
LHDYQLAGCEPATGYPTRAKLADLGLDWLAEQILAARSERSVQTRRRATLAQARGAPSRSATSAPDDDLGVAAAVQHLDGGAVPPA